MNIHSLKSERGSVLWIVLVAVVFMGLLTVMLARNSDSVSQTGDRERVSVKISKVMRNLAGMSTAIDQMMFRGISENEISFKNDQSTEDYTNDNCTSLECLLFDEGGSGLRFIDLPSGVNDGSEIVFTAGNNVGSTSEPLGTTEAGYGNDLIALIPGVADDFCLELNIQVKIGSGDPPESSVDLTPFTGSYPDVLNIISDADKDLDGHAVGCFTDSNDKKYVYYVLKAR